MEPALQAHYKTIIPELKKQLGVENIHEVPRLEKIVINCSIGSQPDRKVAAEDAANDVSLITGQKPQVCLSKKAIANFKLREGEPVGVKVTLRGRRMYDFMLRLVKTAVPRIRDFRGLGTRAFDGRGNYSLGVKEQMIFPEINYDMVEHVHGMDITFVTSSNKDDQALALLRELGMPFKGESPNIPSLT
jgi:large subunit ribosomal protein L5